MGTSDHTAKLPCRACLLCTHCWLHPTSAGHKHDNPLSYTRPSASAVLWSVLTQTPLSCWARSPRPVSPFCPLPQEYLVFFPSVWYSSMWWPLERSHTLRDLPPSLPPHSNCQKVNVLVAQSCSLPGSSVRGILQARILERVSFPRDQTQVSCIAGRFFTVWARRVATVCLSITQIKPVVLLHLVVTSPHHQLQNPLNSLQCL